MKTMAVLAFALAATIGVQASEVTPIEKVVQMLSGLEKKVLAEGAEAQKVYDEYAEFCEDRSRDLGFSIKTAKGEIRDLKGVIEKETADQEALSTKIEEIAGAISTDDADLKAAKEVRAKEEKTFAVEEKELMETISTLERAITILEQQQGSASMVQIKSAKSVAQALSVMVEASFLSSADSQRLASLMQTSEDSDDSDEEPGAPAAEVYDKNSDSGIIQTMEDLLDKAQKQLAEARKSETKSIQAYEMLAQSLKDSIKFADKNMAKAKKALAASKEAEAVAEGDLEVTTKDLEEDTKSLKELHSDCMGAAEDFQAETKSRGEEMKALAVAKKVIEETTGGAAEQTYGLEQVSLLQLSSSDHAKYAAVRVVRELAKTYKSVALTQLAGRMMQIMDHSRSGNPFAKVEKLIREMIASLEAAAEADAAEKAYCDKEMTESATKQEDKEAEIHSLTTKIEGDHAKAAKLKEEVATLQKELAALVKSQAEMDKLRLEEKEAFKVDSAEMAKGIEGVKQALKVLNEYFAKGDKAHDAQDGAAEGIIGLLEVCESDFTKGLAEMTSAEEAAAKAYVKETKENEITKATKTQDVKYKTKEAKGLDKQAAELTADRSTAQDELDAINSYFEGIKKRCIAKPESYDERKKRREAEIAGLKEALSILNGDAVLLQEATHHTLRGASPHTQA